MRTLLLLVLVAAPGAADSLDDALARAGFHRKQLGWTPRGWWSRFPRAVKHKLVSFDDLFADATAIVPFTRTMGRAVKDHLGPEGLGSAPDRNAHSLFRLVWAIGVDRKYAGFRSYTPNLTAQPTPLDRAILELYRHARRQTRFVTFDREAPYPALEKELAAAANKLPAELSGILGRLVKDIIDAHRWATLAFRRVSLEDRIGACRRLDLGVETVDALEYPAVCDDVAAAWDEASLWYAGLKCTEALDRARRALEGKAFTETVSFDWETPLGWIRVRGSGKDTIDGSDALLLVDLGGDDIYQGAVAASTPVRPIGLALDLAGNDAYYGARGPSLGAGMCGVGILLDVQGKDTYMATRYAQGAGQFGLGALIDLAGDDRYVARWSAQGCAYFGIGLLLDGAGRDRYYLHADGQGFGGVGGVGVLADRCGDDTYIAEPDAKVSGRPSYHSGGKISVSNAQGCAMGRRGDGADGHLWAGGLGALLDVEGDDSYSSGNWSMGTGYWFGAGILWDGAGNDRYDGHVWSQATGAHFCIGALIDEAGDDNHLSRQSNSICFGHDFTIALLIDNGGNDTYETPADGLGFSINRSICLLVDTGGDDTYKAKNVPGAARYDKRFADRDALETYWYEARSIGLFLDIGGRDTYADRDRNGAAWGDAPGSDNRKVRNPGVGLDAPSGTVRWR